MHEVITLSFSQASNHLTTHFNNLQESKLHDKSTRGSCNIHLFSTKGLHSNTFNYYPRSILFDYQNGAGSLNPHKYFQPDYQLETPFEIIQTSPRTLVNDYQKQLDNPCPDVKVPELTNADYWSDFSRVIYPPDNILTLSMFDYNPETKNGEHRQTPSRTFSGLAFGKDTYKSSSTLNEIVENQVRKQIEEADMLGHLNAVVEVDTAWSGVSVELIRDLIDGQLDGKSNKILVWGLIRDEEWMKTLELRQKLERIKSLLDLGAECGAFIGLNMDLKRPELDGVQDNKNLSTWETEALHSVPFEFLNSIDDNMSVFLNNLTDGGSRKFINEIRMLWGKKVIDLGCKSFFPESLARKRKIRITCEPHVFARSVITCDKLTGEDDSFAQFENLVLKGTQRSALKRYVSEFSFNNKLDSFPSWMRESPDEISASSFSVTETLKYDFSKMYDYVSAYCRHDEREDLKNQLENLREAYVFGFDDDSEGNTEDDYNN